MNRDVAVIASNDIVDEIKILVNYRKAANVPDENDFLFGLPNGVNGRICILNLCAAMHEFSNSCGAKKPDLLRGTALRKYVATKCVEFELSDNAISDLTKHMGHSEKINNDIYRQPLKSKTIVQITKLLEVAQGDINNDDLDGEDIQSDDRQEYIEYDIVADLTSDGNRSYIQTEDYEIFSENGVSSSTRNDSMVCDDSVESHYEGTPGHQSNPTVTSENDKPIATSIRCK